MKKHIVLSLLLGLLIFPNRNFGQKLSLGSVANFVAFSGTGAISNIGQSKFTGNIGAGVGILSGFDLPTTQNGAMYNADINTTQAKIDLLNFYINLTNIPLTNTSHAAAFGSETITEGVYNIAGAGSLSGAITLDGGGNNNSVFIIKFEGAFTVAVGSTIILANGARSCNVFWVSEGATSVGASCLIRGTILSHPGAISFGVGSSIDGRLLASEGAISFNTGIASIPTSLSTIPITCMVAGNNSILGTAGNFAMFSSAGAVSNASSSSGFIGDIGSNEGSVSGFNTSVVIGKVHNADAATMQAKIDLQSAYDQLMAIPINIRSHLPAFGSNETIFPGVYYIGGAGSIAGKLTLDGQNNPNARFIFKFDGAFNTGAQSKVVLINGAHRSNIFWIAEGAIGMGAFTYMKGTLIAHDGANNMAANGNLEGRMYSTNGAVGFSTGVAYIIGGLCGEVGGPLPVKLATFNGACTGNKILINWSTVSEPNLKNFLLERSMDAINWKLAGTFAGEGSATIAHSYSFNDVAASNGNKYFYRINQIDFSGKSIYSDIIIVKNCGEKIVEDYNIYPNPAINDFTLFYSGDKSSIETNEIYSESGKRVYQSQGFQSKFNVTNLSSGIYYVRIKSKTKMIKYKIVIIK